MGDWELTEYQFRSQLSLGPPAKNSYDIIFNFVRNPIMKEKEQYYYITLSYRINIFFITIFYHRCFNALVAHSNLQITFYLSTQLVYGQLKAQVSRTGMLLRWLKVESGYKLHILLEIYWQEKRTFGGSCQKFFKTFGRLET